MRNPLGFLCAAMACASSAGLIAACEQLDDLAPMQLVVFDPASAEPLLFEIPDDPTTSLGPYAAVSIAGAPTLFFSESTPWRLDVETREWTQTGERSPKVVEVVATAAVSSHFCLVAANAGTYYLRCYNAEQEWVVDEVLQGSQALIPQVVAVGDSVALIDDAGTTLIGPDGSRTVLPDPFSVLLLGGVGGRLFGVSSDLALHEYDAEQDLWELAGSVDQYFGPASALLDETALCNTSGCVDVETGTAVGVVAPPGGAAGETAASGNSLYALEPRGQDSVLHRYDLAASAWTEAVLIGGSTQLVSSQEGKAFLVVALSPRGAE